MKSKEKKTISLQKYFRFARSIYGEDRLEDFFVSAVASVLLIRLYLYLTGYPQVGGSGLHIAHMLWGGILMLVGIFMALGFLSRPAHEWAAVLGGLGFGAFIDELGKFVTNDNNYFFQPTIAMIYVTFVLIYLAIRGVFNYRPLTSRESLANAFEILKQGSINGMTTEDERTILALLDHCDQTDPLAGHLKSMLPHIRIVTSRQPHLVTRLRNRLDDFYQWVITRWWFAGVVIAFFAFTAVTGFSAAISVISAPWNFVLGVAAIIIIILGLLQLWTSRIPNLQIPLTGGVIVAVILAAWAILINPAKLALPFADWAQFVCASISAVLTITGIVYMARSKLTAYQMFHRAVLVSILLTTVFAFYAYQFYALIGVFLNTLILIALRYMISQEKVKVNKSTICSDDTFVDSIGRNNTRLE